MACPYLKKKAPEATNPAYFACASKANPNYEWGCGVDAQRCNGGKDAAGNTYADCPFYKNGTK